MPRLHGKEIEARQGRSEWPDNPSPLERWADAIKARWRERSPSSRARMRAALSHTFSTASRMVGTILGLLMVASGVGLVAAWHETRAIQGSDAAACGVVFLLWLGNRKARSRLQARGLYRAKRARRSWARLSPWPWGPNRHAAKPRRVRLQR